MITEKEILDDLRGLDPARWIEVHDFVAHLKQQEGQKPTMEHSRPLTGRDLYNLGLVGLWADREDIGDSVAFARKLRYEAEHRMKTDDDKER
jgi:hypothetical protein